MKIDKQLRKVLELTRGDMLKIGNTVNIGVAADCKEILRYGEMVPTNCTQLMNYITQNPYLDMDIPIEQNKIGFTPFEHNMIFNHFSKTMTCDRDGFVFHVGYKQLIPVQ